MRVRGHKDRGREKGRRLRGFSISAVGSPGGLTEDHYNKKIKGKKKRPLVDPNNPSAPKLEVSPTGII
jgi:hypothetical protein